MVSTLAPAPVPAVSAPTRLRLPDLLLTTDRAADGYQALKVAQLV